jgi:DNA-binding transcriptional LysR family regulator
MILCASPAYLAREGTPTTPNDLQRAPRLAFSEAVSIPRWTLDDAEGRAHIIDGPYRMQANNMQMLLSATLAGVGIAYGPTFVFGSHLRSGELVELLPEYHAPELTVHAVYPTARYVPSKTRRFIDYLAEAFGDAPPWDDF